jgi:hypothetical protein
MDNYKVKTWLFFPDISASVYKPANLNSWTLPLRGNKPGLARPFLSKSIVWLTLPSEKHLRLLR